MNAQAAISAMLEDAKRYAEQNPKPKREKPLTAAERKAMILEIIQAFHKLGMIQDDAENRKGDAAPTKEQSTANS